MDWGKIFVEVMGLVGASLILGHLWSTIKLRRLAKPSEFAQSIALSLVEKPLAWDYDHSEYCIISRDAELAITVRDYAFGEVTYIGLSNADGSRRVTTFAGIDRRTFKTAYNTWKGLTAGMREDVRQERMRKAVRALA